MLNLIVNVNDPDQSGLLEDFASLRKASATNFVASGESIPFNHIPVVASATDYRPWDVDCLTTDLFEFAIGNPGEDNIAYTDDGTVTTAGVTGSITINTDATAAAFAATTDDSLPFYFTIKRTRVTGEQAEYYRAKITVKRSVIDPATQVPITLPGSIVTSGLTMNTARLLGRGSAGVGSVQEVTIGSGLTLTGTTLTASGTGNVVVNGSYALTSPTAAQFLDANDIASTANNNSFLGTQTLGTITITPGTNKINLGAGAVIAAPDSGGLIELNGATQLVANSTLWDLTTGVLTAGASGTLDFETQAFSTGWTFSGATSATVPNLSLASTSTFPAQLSLASQDSTANASKARLTITESTSGTQSAWRAVWLSINARQNALGGSDAKDDDRFPRDFIALEQYYNDSGTRVEEAHITLNDNRLLFFAVRSANANFASGQVACPFSYYIPAANASGYKAMTIEDARNGQTADLYLVNTNVSGAAGTQIYMSSRSQPWSILTDVTNNGANDFSISQAGTQRFYIGSTGNIGIGNTAPSTKLDVTGTVTATAFSGPASALTAVAETSDTTCFPLFGTAATGSVSPKTNSALTYDAANQKLSSTQLDCDYLYIDGNLVIPGAQSGTSSSSLTNTVTVSAGSPTVTSAGNNVITDGVAVGRYVAIAGEVHEVAARTANTITLATNHVAGASAVNALLIPESSITVNPYGSIDVNAANTLNLNGAAGAVNCVSGLAINLVSSGTLTLNAATTVGSQGTWTHDGSFVGNSLQSLGTLIGASSLALGNNGATGGSITLNGSTSGSAAITVSATGVLQLPNGNLGTPSAIVLTNASGTASININGTVGATTPGTGSFTTLAASGTLTLGTTTSQITGAAGNMTITAGTGNSRTLTLQTTTSGGTATNALTLSATQAATFASSVSAASISATAGDIDVIIGNGFTNGTRFTMRSLAAGEVTFYRTDAASAFTAMNFGSTNSGSSPGFRIALSGTTFTFRATNNTVDASIAAANGTFSGTLAVTGASTLTGAVGIGGSANANAQLDVQSTTKAFMPPRMTTTQKNNIASPTAGMVVYDSTLGKLCVYTGAAWETVTSL